MPKFLNAIDLGLNELQNVRVQSLPSAPADPAAGQLYFDTSTNLLRYFDGTSWTDVTTSGGSGTPTGPAGGELSGSYPNPTLADGVIDNANVKDAAGIVASKLDSTSLISTVKTGISEAKRYSTTVGDGATTNVTVTHNLGTQDVIVQVRGANSPYSAVVVDWDATSISAVTLHFATAPASNAYRVTVLA